MIKVTGFNHITIRISKLTLSLPFYTDILGMKLVHRGKTDVYLEWGTAWICLLETSVERNNEAEAKVRASLSQASVNKQESPAAGMDHIAFSMDERDFESAVERLRSFNVNIVRGPILRGGGWSINFLDPDGIELELFTGSLVERMRNWS